MRESVTVTGIERGGAKSSAGLFVNSGSSDGFARRRRIGLHRPGKVVSERTGPSRGLSVFRPSVFYARVSALCYLL